MNKTFNVLTALVSCSVILIGIVALLAYFNFDLMRLQLSPVRTISVTGLGIQNELNQQAMFSANLNATGDDKQIVNTELKRQADELTRLAIDFGIEEKNIKTEYFNIYQEETRDYYNPETPVRKGPWMGNSNISFQKIPSDRVQDFADLLANSGANNISGPNYGLEDIREIEGELVTSALEDAKVKAAAYAQSQGFELGKILSIDTTGGNSGGMIPLMREQGGGGGGDLSFNAGESEVTKYVVVVYELK